MTDSEGNVCADSPPWTSEGPTSCPGSSSSGSSGPTYHRFSDPAAIETTGGVRIAMRSSDPSIDQIEIVVLDLATSAVSYPEPLDGPSGVPQLAGDDTGAYLVWTDREFHSFGATLTADNALGEAFEFGKIAVKPLAVGDRFLVIEYGLGHQQARWIEANGTVGAAFDFPGAVADSTPRGTSGSGGGIAATMFRRDNAIYVARTNGLEVELAQDSGMGGLAVLPDGTILATYSKALTPTAYAVFHNVRIEPDGTTTDEIIQRHLWSDLVVAGDRLFAIVDDPYQDTYFAYELDSSGTAIGDKVEIFEPDTYSEVSVVPYHRDLVAFSSTGTIEATSFDGAAGAPPVVIAEYYEIDDGGCSTGGGAGFAIVLAFAGIRRRRTRR